MKVHTTLFFAVLYCQSVNCECFASIAYVSKNPKLELAAKGRSTKSHHITSGSFGEAMADLRHSLSKEGFEWSFVVSAKQSPASILPSVKLQAGSIHSVLVCYANQIGAQLIYEEYGVHFQLTNSAKPNNNLSHDKLHSRPNKRDANLLHRRMGR